MSEQSPEQSQQPQSIQSPELSQSSQASQTPELSQPSQSPRASQTKSLSARVISWVAVVAWAGVIFFMSSNSGTGLNEGLGVFSSIYQVLKEIQASLLGPGVDVLSSIAHFCEYTVFGMLLAHALGYHLTLRRACILAVVCASLYGVSDEIHQLFVPDRMCDPIDWMVDTAGATLGASIMYVFKHA